MRTGVLEVLDVGLGRDDRVHVGRGNETLCGRVSLQDRMPLRLFLAVASEPVLRQAVRERCPICGRALYALTLG